MAEPMELLQENGPDLRIEQIPAMDNMQLRCNSPKQVDLALELSWMHCGDYCIEMRNDLQTKYASIDSACRNVIFKRLQAI